MAKLVVFTRERRSENWKQSDYFIAEDHVENVEESMRKAVDAFLFTEEGKKMIDYSCEDFNWGDALSSVSADAWCEVGIQPKYDDKTYEITGEIIEITVNQDEVLCRDEHLGDSEE